jgi:hypothetical protein
VKTIIAGSREGVTFKDVLTAIRDCGWKLTGVVSGTALGADTEGEKAAKLLGIPVHRFPANWEKYGRAAGPIRNRQMAENAEALIAVWDGVSRGTKNMIEEAKARNLAVYVHHIKK